MKSKTMLTISAVILALAVGRAAVSTQDKYDLRVPGGLGLAEFKGYEDWPVVAVQHTDDLVKVVVGNAVAMEAFRAGIPGNGRPFPDGSRMAKLEWKPKQNSDVPYDIAAPGPNYALEFMVKDSKRFADSGGWGYALFVPDGTTGAYRAGTQTHRPPQGNDAKCGFACHTRVKAKDYVFTDYAKR